MKLNNSVTHLVEQAGINAAMLEHLCQCLDGNDNTTSDKIACVKRLVDTSGAFGDLTEGMEGGLAVLRTLKARLDKALDDYGQRDEALIPDVYRLLEMVFSVLPDPAGDTCETLEMTATNTSNVVSALVFREEMLLDAMTDLATANNPDSSLEDVQKAANRLYERCSVIPNGQAQWQSFCHAVAARDWSVSLLSVGAYHFPEVQTRAMQDNQPAMDRQISSLLDTVGQAKNSEHIDAEELVNNLEHPFGDLVKIHLAINGRRTTVPMDGELLAYLVVSMGGSLDCSDAKTEIKNVRKQLQNQLDKENFSIDDGKTLARNIRLWVMRQIIHPGLIHRVCHSASSKSSGQLLAN